jgi:serine protease Do
MRSSVLLALVSLIFSTSSIRCQEEIYSSLSPGMINVARRNGNYAGLFTVDRKCCPGAYVSSVIKGSPAKWAGIIKRDLILYFNGQMVMNSRHLSRLITTTPARMPVNVVVEREGRRVDLEVTLVERSDPVSYIRRKPDTLFTTQKKIGVYCHELTRQLAFHFGLLYSKGLLIAKVVENSPAERAGIRAGDVILEVNSSPVRRITDLNRELKVPEGTICEIRIVRRSKPLTLRVVPVDVLI